MSENTKDTLKAIGIILLFTVAFWPFAVLPFFGVSVSMALYLNAMWIWGAAVFIVFGGILFGLLIVPILWFLFGGPSYSTLPDTQKAAIQRARLESRGYRINYFRPAPNHDLPTKR